MATKGPLKLRYKNDKNVFDNLDTYTEPVQYSECHDGIAKLSLDSEVKDEYYMSGEDLPLDLTTSGTKRFESRPSSHPYSSEDDRSDYASSEYNEIYYPPNMYAPQDRVPLSELPEANYGSYDSNYCSSLTSSAEYSPPSHLDHDDRLRESNRLVVKPVDSINESYFLVQHHEMDSYDDLYRTGLNSPTDSMKSSKCSDAETKRRQRQSKAYYDQLTEDERKERHRRLDNERSRQYRTRRRQLKTVLVDDLEREEKRSMELQHKVKDLERQKFLYHKIIAEYQKSKIQQHLLIQTPSLPDMLTVN